jgi:hypothetical protein
MRARVKETAERAKGLPHREKYLNLGLEFIEGLIGSLRGTRREGRTELRRVLTQIAQPKETGQTATGHSKAPTCHVDDEP